MRPEPSSARSFNGRGPRLHWERETSLSAQTTTQPIGHDVLGPAAEATQRLYEVYGAQVFGYCLGRLGSRPEAEDAVEKTFVRAANALSRGELPDQELTWLLRISDRVCSSRRRLAWIRSRADATWLVPPTDERERVKIVAGWEGRTFEEIAAEYDDRTARLMQARGDLAATLGRGPLAILPLGPVFGWLKALFSGASAVKVGAAAIAVTASTVVVATPLADTLHDAVRPAASKPDERTPASSQPTSRTANETSSGTPRSSPSTQRQTPTRGPAPTKRTTAAKPARPAGTRVPRADSAGVGAGGSTGTPAGGGEQGAGGQTSQPSGTGGEAPSGGTPKAGSDTPRVSTPQAPTVSTPSTPTVSTPSTPTVSTPTITTPNGGGTQTTPTETPTLPDVPDVDAPAVDAPAVSPSNVDLPKTSVP